VGWCICESFAWTRHLPSDTGSLQVENLGHRIYSSQNPAVFHVSGLDRILMRMRTSPLSLFDGNSKPDSFSTSRRKTESFTRSDPQMSKMLGNPPCVGYVQHGDGI
jgi:hypothetical protein